MTNTIETKGTGSARERLLDAEKQLNETFINREDAIRVIIAAHLTSTNYLLVGDPGTAKTALASSFSKHVVNQRYFSTLLGRFTTPEKIFGALDIEKFKQGVYQHVVKGMLPDADTAFLDEGYKCNDGAFNELLTVLNERTFGGQYLDLFCVGSATNWPELERRDEIVEALHDRFLLRVAIEDITDEDQLADMLTRVETAAAYDPRSTVSLDELRAIQKEVAAVTISDDIRKLLASVRNRVVFKGTGREAQVEIAISSRRTGQLQKVLRASAWLAGRTEVTVEDFDILRFGMWVDRGDIAKVEDVISKVDADEVRKTVALIDEARTAVADFLANHGGPAALEATYGTVKAKTEEAKALFERPVYTARGRRAVRTSMKGLKEDFAKLQEVRNAAG